MRFCPLKVLIECGGHDGCGYNGRDGNLKSLAIDGWANGLIAADRASGVGAICG